MPSILLETFFFRSWWVIAFIFTCSILYEQGLKERDNLYKQLTEQLHDLQHEKLRAIELQQNLQLQINSQSDLAWIELTLMKGLGLVPEGQQKAYFSQDEFICCDLANDQLLSQ